MPAFRTKSVSTKVSDEEYALFEKLAGEETISEWARDILLKAAKPNTGDLVLLTEVMALRTILLNAFYKLAHGETISPDEMQRLIEHADEGKFRKAKERLEVGANRGAE